MSWLDSIRQRRQKRRSRQAIAESRARVARFFEDRNPPKRGRGKPKKKARRRKKGGGLSGWVRRNLLV